MPANPSRLFWLFRPSLRPTRLVTCSPRLDDDTVELVDLSLGAGEGAEPLLGQLPGALILAVAEQFDNAALVRGETSVNHLVSASSRPKYPSKKRGIVNSPGDFLDDLTHEGGTLAQLALAPRDLGLNDTGGGFLCPTRQESASIVCKGLERVKEILGVRLKFQFISRQRSSTR
jgi:hypothetical protein